MNKADKIRRVQQQLAINGNYSIDVFESVATHSRDFSRELVATYVGQKTI